ncbi:FAD-dependent oxidoreductase [Streptomyces sp. NPDC056296]|uniref:FAD-dependent oxidoreductase n=1 Tax=Streptomyces sp. NPDC056296 TaxID=3345775 RepID=UPI0035E2B0AD
MGANEGAICSDDRFVLLHEVLLQCSRSPTNTEGHVAPRVLGQGQAVERSSVMAPERVVVVGAGTVGLSCALLLQEYGVEVEVLDRGSVGNGAS